jgi:LPXTG-site transpeptidase (sortase) family protein
LRQSLLFRLGGASLVAGAAIISIGLVGYFILGQLVAPQESATDFALYRAISVDDVEYMPAVPYDPLASTDPEPEPQLAAPARLVIESIGVDAPVSTFGLDPNGVPTVPTDGDAAQTVAWYDFSAMPGAGSNAVFAGHVTWNGPAVFWSLDQLQVGDTIKVEGEDEREYVYEVATTFLVDPTDPDSVSVMAATTSETITLITCGGTWAPDPSDTVAGGAYASRMIVQGRLAQPSVAAPGSTSEE